MIKKAFAAFVASWWKFPAGLCIGLVITTYSPSLVPVVVFMNAKDWHVFSDYVEARVSGYKLRCILIASSEVGYVRSRNQPWTEVPFEFKNDPTPGNSKPFGFHNFGIWHWESPPEVTAFETMTTVDHDCDGKIVTTTIGPFRVRT